MTEQELIEQRTANWRTGGNAACTIEDARSFVDAVGLCLIYPDRSLPLLPTFIGAFTGTAAGLPDAKHSFADARAQQATELVVRLLREKSAFEASLAGDVTLLVSATLFPFLYALLSDRTPKAPPTTKAQGVAVSPLAARVFTALQEHGPLSKSQLQQRVGRETSLTALDRTLGELWSFLKITRVDYNSADGALWDVLYRWAPSQVKEGIQISEPEAISALLSKYLEAVVAVEQEAIEQLFSRVTSRAKIRDAINALLQARELSFVTVGSRTLIRMTPPPEQQRRRQHG
ncbi:MAG TPA: crosslink repair DNA glycosylase YcaQ family protein [Candidatus Angelobacter sp.]|nr:crosslink repair DNA glycosylase YcaQ family protein [Candidatus Angelobacter sp.]